MSALHSPSASTSIWSLALASGLASTACVGKITDRIPPGSQAAGSSGEACSNGSDTACGSLLPTGGSGAGQGGSAAGGSSSGEGDGDLPLDETDDGRGGGNPREDDDDRDEDVEPARDVPDAGPPPEDDPDEDPAAEPVADAGADAGESPVLTPLFLFDESAQGWTLVSSDPAALLAASNLEHDPAIGLGAPGSLIFDAPFDGPSQRLAAQVTLAIPLNLEGRSVAVSIRLEDGVLGSDQARLDARLEARTGAGGVLANGAETRLDAERVVTLVLSLDAPVAVDGNVAEHDAGDVRAIGLRLFTGDGGAYLGGRVRVDDVVVF